MTISTVTSDWEAALERWKTYEREVYLANTAYWKLIDTALPDPAALSRFPTVVLPREDVARFRASYMLLLNGLAELLGLDPKEFTQLDLIAAMAKRAWAETKKERGEDPCPYPVEP